MPDLGGAIPAAWNEIIDHLGEVEHDSRRRQELEARLQVWILFADLRARQVQERVSLVQAKTITRATWALVAFTFLLAVATVAAGFIAKSHP